MAMTRRTFGQLITAAAVAVALPIKTAVAEVKSKLNLTQSGTYAVIALVESTYREGRPVWPRLKGSYTWEMIRQHGVYDPKIGVWWLKLAAIKSPVFDQMKSMVDRPAGGPATMFSASFVAMCADGMVYDTVKNTGLAFEIPPQMHTHATKTLRPRLNPFMDEPPHIEVVV